MPVTTHSVDENIQHLVDIEDIRRLVASFARAIDTKNQPAYAATFVEDALLELPFGTQRGRAAIAAMKGPPPGTHSHHLFGQIMIDIDGDTASCISYMQATHVFSDTDLSAKAHSGGWYEQELTRTPEGWLFTRVKLVISWADERPMIPTNPNEIGAITP